MGIGSLKSDTNNAEALQDLVRAPKGGKGAHQVAELFELRDDHERAIGVGDYHQLRAYPVKHLKTTAAAAAEASVHSSRYWQRERAAWVPSAKGT